MRRIRACRSTVSRIRIAPTLPSRAAPHLWRRHGAAPEDRRKQCLALTAKGRAAVGRAPKAVQQQLIAAITALPARDRRVLARSLETVARRVAPDIIARAPMLFEERAGPAR